MKSVLFVAGLALTMSFPAVACDTPGKGEIKRVCHTKKDKNGKEITECKDIKVRKKLEGTKVPDNPPKK